MITLPSGIPSLSSYVDIKSKKIISSDVDMNEYKLLGTKSKQIVSALKLLKMSLILGLKTKRTRYIEIWWFRKWFYRIHRIEYSKNKIYGD